MPKQLVEDQLWAERISSQDKYYKSWEKRFKCKLLEDYYEGKQWGSQEQIVPPPYVINKFFETIQIKLAAFIPTFPKFLVNPRGANSEYDLEAAAKSATLKQDTLNTIINDPSIHFMDELQLAYKDHFSRFGMIEVGYAADWVLNPNAAKPFTEKNAQLNAREHARLKKEPAELPANERIYFKHIPAKHFRIGGMDHKYLNRCGWCGYYDWVYKSDLLTISSLMNKDKIESSSGATFEDFDGIDPDRTERMDADIVKVFHCWDLRSQQRLIILTNPTVTIYARGLKRLNLFDFRPDRRITTGGFYPVPPSYHWISSQNEINETRQQLRNHRRRFSRKFQCVEGTVDDLEIEKFETGPDGAIVTVKRENAISLIESGDLGKALDESMAFAPDDLNRISGTTDEDRGVADRVTATASNIVNSRAALRENSDRDKIVTWLAGMGREALLVMRDKFTLGMWVQLSSTEGETFLGGVLNNAGAIKFVTTEDLKDGYDFRIDIDVTSLSSAAQELEKKKFLEFLAVLTQYPMIAFSPILVREAAFRCGYRNEPAIKELQKVALLMELGRQQQLQGAIAQTAQPQPGNAPQQTVATQTPPQMEQIRQQLTNQMPGAGVQ